MTTYSIKTKVTETGKLTLDHLPFEKGDEISIMISKNYQNTVQSSWSQEFLDFQGISESINFESYRSELLPPQENIFA
jgi:hypothetical protein